MVLNADKCHYMVLGTNNKKDQSDLTCNEGTLKITKKEEKILGIIIDNQLRFQSHINHICKEANKKLSALSHVQKYMKFEQKKLLFKSFIQSQFNYCPLIWMFCNKTSIQKINKIHERSMRLILNDYSSDFNTLLEHCNDISIHQRCINALMIEVYKYINGLSPGIMNEIFTLRSNTYNLRNFYVFETSNPRNNRFGIEAIAYRASQLWHFVPNDIKNLCFIAFI